MATLFTSNKRNCGMQKCNKTLKYIGGSTSSLSAHIKNVHGINISEDFSLEESDSALKKQKTLTGFIQRKSIEEEISRLASVDGLSFRCIAKSTFIQENLRKSKYDRPHSTSHEGVKHMVLSFYNNKKTNSLTTSSLQ